MDTRTVVPLWEIRHPQSCATANYFKTGQNFQYGSWEEFFEACGDISVEWNLVFRWDWIPNDCEVGDDRAALREYADRFGDRDHAWKLQLFRMIQGNGIFQCTEIQVCKADEPAVRAWLAPRAEHLRALWQPLLDPVLDPVLDPAASAPSTAETTAVTGDKVIAAVAVVDVARDLPVDYRSGLRQTLYGGDPEHDYRLHLLVSRGEVTMHAGATADDVVEYLERDRQAREQGH